MLKLGHIVYSNCLPPHAGVIAGINPLPFEIVEGIPTELNRRLFEGVIDVSPSSSIEFALNPGRYRLLPGFSITSKNKAMSILLESRHPLEALESRTIALTTASSTSVVLLRILLEMKTGVHPNYVMYEQGREDPLARADAALTIGDLALRKTANSTAPYVYDLGELWHAFTGLPFVFALWQVNYKKSIDNELKMLYDVLSQSKAFGMAHLRELADSHAERFGFSPDILLRYWNSFSYDLGAYEIEGLQRYFGYAAELGAIATVPDLAFAVHPER